MAGMMFCDKCGSIMVPVKSEKGNVYFVCRKCGRRKMVGTKSFKITTKNQEKKDVVVVKKKETLPTTTKMCPKCGHQEAYYWVQQTRSMDEPPTQFFKCTKCGHTWREY